MLGDFLGYRHGSKLISINYKFKYLQIIVSKLSSSSNYLPKQPLRYFPSAISNIYYDKYLRLKGPSYDLFLGLKNTLSICGSHL